MSNRSHYRLRQWSRPTVSAPQPSVVYDAWTLSATWRNLYSGRTYNACSIWVTANCLVTGVRYRVQKAGLGPVSFALSVWSSGLSFPAASLSSSLELPGGSVPAGDSDVVLALPPVALSVGPRYWVVAHSTGATSLNHLKTSVFAWAPPFGRRTVGASSLPNWVNISNLEHSTLQLTGFLL